MTFTASERYTCSLCSVCSSSLSAQLHGPAHSLVPSSFTARQWHSYSLRPASRVLPPQPGWCRSCCRGSWTGANMPSGGVAQSSRGCLHRLRSCPAAAPHRPPTLFGRRRDCSLLRRQHGASQSPWAAAAEPLSLFLDACLFSPVCTGFILASRWPFLRAGAGFRRRRRASLRQHGSL